MDERNRAIVGKICIILYALTIYFLFGDMLYRQFVLHQTPEQFEDIATLTTGNVLLFIALLLYYGGVSVGRFRLGRILAGYVLFVILGIAFTAFKYGVWTLDFLLAKAVIVISISAAIFIVALTLALLGRQRIERDLE
jgi:hypothetical protein